jgi:uncharacterized repeat protein (TIGR01451 family)
LVVVLALALPHAALAAPSLSIEPLTWNVVGLDSNDVATGPDTFLVGARVCNPGDAAATNVTVTFVWDSANPFVLLDGAATHARGDLDPGACIDEYFNVRVVRDPSAYDTARGFHITATADGGLAVGTPQPRELFVERLISQARNDAISIDGPTEVLVGQTVQYTALASTATNGYEQLQNFYAFDTDIFDIISIEQTYTAPPGATNDRPYADACGWDADPTSPSYLTCVGPEQFTGGKAGGDLVTVYTMRVVGEGTQTVSDLIYDFSGSSFHYNADRGEPSITITAVAPADLELSKVVDRAQIVVGDTVTFAVTLANLGPATATGVQITDAIPADLEVVDSAVSVGALDLATGVWSLDTLAPGATATLTLTVGADEAGTFTNTVEVTASERPDPDSTPGNGDPTEDDWSSATVTVVTAPPDLDLRKVADATGPVRPGDRIGYTLELLNVGAETATAVVLTDPTPEHATYVPGSVTIDGEPVDDAAGNPLETALVIGDVPAGATVVVEYVVEVAADAPAGTIVNVATATADGIPPVTATTSTPVEVPVAAPAGPDPPPTDTAAIPATGLQEDPGTGGGIAALSIAAGFGALLLAHRLDRTRRLRAIHLARLANASAWGWDLPWRPGRGR